MKTKILFFVFLLLVKTLAQTKIDKDVYQKITGTNNYIGVTCELYPSKEKINPPGFENFKEMFLSKYYSPTQKEIDTIPKQKSDTTLVKFVYYEGKPMSIAVILKESDLSLSVRYIMANEIVFIDYKSPQIISLVVSVVSDIPKSAFRSDVNRLLELVLADYLFNGLEIRISYTYKGDWLYGFQPFTIDMQYGYRKQKLIKVKTNQMNYGMFFTHDDGLVKFFSNRF